MTAWDGSAVAAGGGPAGERATACGTEQDAGLAPAPHDLVRTCVHHERAEPGPVDDGAVAHSAAAPPARRPSSAPARGTVPPPWLGTRVLPETVHGYGEVRPTPRVMRVRRWNTRDSIPALPGDGFKAMVADPAPKRVIARSTWQPGCPVGAGRPGVDPADLLGLRRRSPLRRDAGQRLGGR